MNIFRRQKINEYIQTHGKASYAELQELVPDVSCMTLRRDLEALEGEGSILRVRGGARPVSSLSGEREDKYAIRAAENIPAKTDIASKALQFIEAERATFLDSGSTMMLLAGKLENDFYSIITAAPNIAFELLKNHKIDLTIVGGHLNRNTLSVSGINSLRFVEEINIDTAIMATSGYSSEYGFTNGEYNEGELKKAVIRKARKVVMIMDLSKVDKNLSYTFATLKDIDVIITDKKPSPELMKEFQNAGVELVY